MSGVAYVLFLSCCKRVVKGLGETLVGAYPGRAMSLITKMNKSKISYCKANFSSDLLKETQHISLKLSSPSPIHPKRSLLSQNSEEAKAIHIPFVYHLLSYLNLTFSYWLSEQAYWTIQQASNHIQIRLKW